MSNTAKLIVVGILALLAGFCGGMFAANAVVEKAFGGPAEQAVSKLHSSMDYLISRKGEVLSADASKKFAHFQVAMNTIELAQSFNQFSDASRQTEALRLVKLINDTPSLRASDGGVEAWASDARRCIVDNQNDGEVIAACVRKSKNAPVMAVVD